MSKKEKWTYRQQRRLGGWILGAGTFHRWCRNCPKKYAAFEDIAEVAFAPKGKYLFACYSSLDDEIVSELVADWMREHPCFAHLGNARIDEISEQWPDGWPEDDGNDPDVDVFVVSDDYWDVVGNAKCPVCERDNVMGDTIFDGALLCDDCAEHLKVKKHVKMAIKAYNRTTLEQALIPPPHPIEQFERYGDYAFGNDLSVNWKLFQKDYLRVTKATFWYWRKKFIMTDPTILKQSIFPNRRHKDFYRYALGRIDSLRRMIVSDEIMKWRRNVKKFSPAFWDLRMLLLKEEATIIERKINKIALTLKGKVNENARHVGNV
jgi:hypothetical protein